MQHPHSPCAIWGALQRLSCRYHCPAKLRADSMDGVEACYIQVLKGHLEIRLSNREIPVSIRDGQVADEQTAFRLESAHSATYRLTTSDLLASAFRAQLNTCSR